MKLHIIPQMKYGVIEEQKILDLSSERIIKMNKIPLFDGAIVFNFTFKYIFSKLSSFKLFRI